MTGTCIVANCNSGYEISEKPIAFFNVPKDADLRQKWIDAIQPNTNIPLNTTDMVCEKHFCELDIIRHYCVRDAAGNVIEKVAYDYPRLTDTAVPSIFSENSLRSAAAGSVQTDSVYDCILQNAITDVVVHGIHQVDYHPHHVNEVDMPKVTENHASESQSLMGTAAISDISSPVNDNSPADAMALTANALDAVSNSCPVPILIQPTSTSVPTVKIADNGLNDDGDGCCECNDECCGCDDCGDCGDCCDCVGCCECCASIDCNDCVLS